MPIISAIQGYLQGDGAAILPEMELVLFGLGILLIDFWIEREKKYWNAGLALLGTAFSGLTLIILRGKLVVRGEFAGFHDSAIVDQFFLFFGFGFCCLNLLYHRYDDKPALIKTSFEPQHIVLFHIEHS
jgi:NADH:ubiquinone oxidoreductase subunit 2 (subunit N)